MTKWVVAEAFVEEAKFAPTRESLISALERACALMGVDYFALVHHVDFGLDPGCAIRLHNYPREWQEWFDERHLGRADPVHRASHLKSVGFPWSDVPDLINLTQDDRVVFDAAPKFGIGDGFTVPANVPGELHGSCSFAMRSGECFPADHQNVAQLIGSFAFEAARRLSRARGFVLQEVPILTARQRDCVLWVARGKTDWEIAQILGVSRETVIQHLKQARERYGSPKRALLTVRALFDGIISFSDVLKH